MRQHRIVLVGLLLAVCSCVFMAGCGGKSGPEGTVEKMLQAAQAGDVDGMLNCMTPESREFIRQVTEAMGKELNAETLLQSQSKPKSYKLGDAQINGESATVKATIVTEAGDENTQDVPLKLVDGKWLVDGTRGTTPAQRAQLLEGLKKMKGTLGGMKPPAMPTPPTMPKAPEGSATK